MKNRERNILLVIFPVISGFLYNYEKLNLVLIICGLVYALVFYLALSYIDSKYDLNQKLTGMKYIAWFIFLVALILVILALR